MYSRCCLLNHLESCFGKKPCCSLLSFSRAYFRALLLAIMGKFKRLFNSRGCLGCCTASPPVISVDKPSRALRVQDQTLNRPSVTEDYWSSSAHEMDNSAAVWSERSFSTQTNDPQSIDVGNTIKPPEFVNHGLLLWNETRNQWLGTRASQIRTGCQEPRISLNTTYESLLGTNKPFQQPIPLPEMIDFLVGIWEQEGLYD